MKTISEIRSTMKLHHTASRRGYESRKTGVMLKSTKADLELVMSL